MERETKTIETKVSKTKVELKTYITAAEARVIGIASEGKFGTTSEKNFAVADKTMELCIVSIDGSKEAIIKKVMDLPLADYTQIAEEIRKLSSTGEELEIEKKVSGQQ